MGFPGGRHGQFQRFVALRDGGAGLVARAVAVRDPEGHRGETHRPGGVVVHREAQRLVVERHLADPPFAAVLGVGDFVPHALEVGTEVARQGHLHGTPLAQQRDASGRDGQRRVGDSRGLGHHHLAMAVPGHDADSRRARQPAVGVVFEDEVAVFTARLPVDPRP